MKPVYIFLFVYLLLNNQIINCKENNNKYNNNNNRHNKIKSQSFIGICQIGQTSKINNGGNIDDKESNIKIGYLLDKEEREKHELYMKIVVDIANEYNNKYASIIVSPNGIVLCSGIDSTNDNVILKSELLAITNCSASYSMSTFEDHTIYSTCEPDSLSSSAIVYAKFKKVVYGSSLNDLFCRACIPFLPVDSSFIFSKSYGIGLNYQIEQISGILKEKTDQLFNSQCSNGLIKPQCQCTIANNDNNNGRNTNSYDNNNYNSNNNNNNNNNINNNNDNNNNNNDNYKQNKNKNKNKNKYKNKYKHYKQISNNKKYKI